MTTFYIGASFPRKDEAQALRDRICGETFHKVQADWINQAKDFQDDEAGRRYAIRDIEELRQVDSMICFTGDTLSKGGRHTELGVAIGIGKVVHIIGPMESVFHRHPLVMQHDTVDNFMAWLKG